MVLWVPAPTGGLLFSREKSNQKRAGDTPVPDILSDQPLSNLGHLCTELDFCHLIYRGSINGASASGPVKERHVSFCACRNNFLKTHLREYPKKFRTGLFRCVGFQRGTGVPICVVVGVGYIGEGPHRKGPAPMRAFGYFSHERKVTRGPGLEAPRILGLWGQSSQKGQEEKTFQKAKKPLTSRRIYGILLKLAPGGVCLHVRESTAMMREIAAAGR